MLWSGNFRTAVASLRQSKWRSILTMLGIIIGITSVVTVISLGVGLKTQVVGQINQLGSDVLTVRSGKIVTQQSSLGFSSLNLLAFLNSSTLTDKDVSVLSKLPSINAVAPLDFLTSSVNASGAELDNVFVLGTSPELLGIMHQKIAYGNFIDNDQNNQTSVVIGSNIAHELFHELNPVGESINISGQTLIVRGVLAPSAGGLLSIGETDSNSAVFMPFQTARALAGGHSNILQILVRNRSGHDLDSAILDVNKALAASHSGQQDFTVLKQDQLLGLVGGVVNTVTDFVSSIAAISLLVGGIGIMDIMLVSISERTREIGIRKAIGATNGQILNQFLTEGMVLTISGGIIGVLFSLLLNVLLRLYTSLHPVINLPVVLLAVGVSVLVGITFSVIPALKAARKDPIVALRGE